MKLEIPEANICKCKIMDFQKLRLKAQLEFEGKSSTKYGHRITGLFDIYSVGPLRKC
jgi:hypothetical protein